MVEREKRNLRGSTGHGRTGGKEGGGGWRAPHHSTRGGKSRGGRQPWGRILALSLNRCHPEQATWPLAASISSSGTDDDDEKNAPPLLLRRGLKVVSTAAGLCLGSVSGGCCCPQTGPSLTGQGLESKDLADSCVCIKD